MLKYTCQHSVGNSFASLNFDLPVTFWATQGKESTLFLLPKEKVPVLLNQEPVKHCIIEQEETFFPVVYFIYLSYGQISGQGNIFLLALHYRGSG